MQQHFHEMAGHLPNFQHNKIKSEHVAYEYILEAIPISKGSLSSPADWGMQAYNCQKSQIKM